MIFHSEPAVVICNGPSLNAVNNDELDQFYTLGQNRIYLRYNPDTLALGDDCMVFSPELQTSLLEAMPLSEDVVLASTVERFFLRDDLPEHVRFLNWVNPKKDGELMGVFSINPAEVLVAGGSTTYVLLQLALSKGYNKVLIVGMDHTFVGPEGDHFSEEYNKLVGIPYEMETRGRYGLGHGNWPFSQKQFVAKTNEFFAIAKRVFDENGGWIRNCSSYTECDVFDKDEWRFYAKI